MLTKIPSFDVAIKLMVIIQGNKTLKHFCENSNFYYFVCFRKTDICRCTTDTGKFCFKINQVLMKKPSITILVKFLVIDLANSSLKDICENLKLNLSVYFRRAVIGCTREDNLVVSKND